MNAWLHAHDGAMRDALAHARRAPFATLFAVAVLALALALPLVGFVVVAGLARITAQFDTDPQMSVFLPLEATPIGNRTLLHVPRSALPGKGPVWVIKLSGRSLCRKEY